MVRIGINGIELWWVPANDPGDVFFNPDPIFLRNQGLAPEGRDNEMGVQVIEFDFHINKVNKVGQLYWYLAAAKDCRNKNNVYGN